MIKRRDATVFPCSAYYFTYTLCIKIKVKEWERGLALAMDFRLLDDCRRFLFDQKSRRIEHGPWRLSNALRAATDIRMRSLVTFVFAISGNLPSIFACPSGYCSHTFSSLSSTLRLDTMSTEISETRHCILCIKANDNRYIPSKKTKILQELEMN